MSSSEIPAQGVLVTGASTGIGRATALWLADAGFRVFGGVRKPADGEALHEASGGRVEPVSLDITDDVQISAAVERIERALGDAGRLAAIVNNAGIVVAGPLEFVAIDRLRWQLEVNVVAQLAVTQAFLPRLRRDKGRAVFVGSASGFFTAPFVGAYSASKHALEALCDALRVELRTAGVPVVLVQPGAIATPIWEKSERSADDDLADLPALAHERYATAMTRVRAEVTKRARGAIPAETVARVIERAITARSPHHRYRVGADATLQLAMVRLLPRGLIDRVMSHALFR